MLNLEVGKTYLDRCGKKVKIIKELAHADHPFVGENDKHYYKDGKFNCYMPDPNINDLISLVVEEPTYSQGEAFQAARDSQFKLIDGVVKYTPGQLLNNAAEVFEALLAGEKITAGAGYLQLIKGHLKDEFGSAGNAYLSNPGWKIYQPKRKIKTERWFAIIPHYKDVAWVLFKSGQEAKNAYPDALAYVKAGREVEIDE